MVKANWTALPVVLLAATFVAGETMGFTLSAFAGLWAWILLIVVLLLSVHIEQGLPCGLHLIVFLTGVALAWHSESERFSVEACSHTTPPGGGAPMFHVRVEGDAKCRTDRKGHRMASFNSWVKNVPVKVIAALPDGVAAPKDGEWWRCSGWLSLRKNSASRYSRRMLWVMRGNVFAKAGDADVSSAGLLYRRLSHSLSNRVKKGIEWSEDLASFGNAMLLGRRDGIPYGKLSVFSVAGTIHVFAISGLHVMLIAGMLSGLLKALGLSSRMCAACSIPILSAYVMLIGSPPSAVRAAVMTSLYLAAPLFGRKPDSLSAWGVSVMLIYAISPEMVFNVGCILSFAVMLGILLWLRWSAQFASPADCFLKIAAVELAFGCGRRKALALWLYRRSSWLFGALGISLAAWIAGVPIAAIVFGRLSLGSLAINVAVVPLAGMAVGFAVFGVLASFVLPQLGIFFSNLAALSIYLMQWLSETVVKLPGTSVETLPWSWLDCAMWYVAWFAIFALLSRHLPRREHIAVKEWEKDDA